MLRGDVWEWNCSTVKNLGDPTMVQAGLLRAAIMTALDCDGKATICLDYCLAKRDWS